MDTDVKQQIQQRYESSDKYLVQKRETWDELEQLFHNQLQDQISSTTKSQVFDPVLADSLMQRTYRVNAQLATGKVKAMSKNDAAASKLMNLTLDKYIIPNATAQFDFLTKLRLVDMYSGVYGTFFVMVDWDIKKNGIIAPDMWLIPIRNVFPQAGAVSVADSDHIIIKSFRPISFFESIAKEEGVKNMSSIIEKLNEKAGDKQNRDGQYISQRELKAYPTAEPNKGDGFWEVLSMFEGDRWVDYVPAADEVFRDAPNPHEDGELPVIQKHSIPLLDDLMGLSDFERGKSMQLAGNSLWNLYLDGVKVSIFPPAIINKDQIADKGSYKWAAAAKWLAKGNPATAAQVMNLTPQGIQTFQTTLGAIKASIMNGYGTTDTTISASTDPGFGKTPEALKLQAARQNASDSADRFYMEQFVTAVCKKFVNLMSIKGDKVQIRMFEDEIEELQGEYPQVGQLYDEKTGKLTIDKSKTGSIIYDYEIVSGSSYATDLQSQQDNLLQLFNRVTNGMQVNPQTGEVTSPVIQALSQENTGISLKELLTRLIANAGIQDWDKIIFDKSKNPDNLLDEHAKQFQNIMQSMMGASNIPATPGAPAGAGAPQMPQMPPQANPLQAMQGGLNGGAGQAANNPGFAS